MKRNRRSLSVYGVATVLSLIAHVSCFALLEGIMLLAEIRFDGPPQARILFETRQVPTAERTPSGGSRFNVTYVGRSDRSSEVKIQGVHRNPVKRDRRIEKTQWQGWFQSFVTDQAEVDRRIATIKDRLNTLGIDAEIPSIYVSDTDRVSRKNLDGQQASRMRDYLAQMRSKIRSLWLKKVSSANIRPGVVTIEYRIDSSGTISNLKTLSLKGDRDFYRSCLSAAEDSSPFGPLPPDLNVTGDTGFIIVKLTFYLRGFDRHENSASVA